MLLFSVYSAMFEFYAGLEERDKTEIYTNMEIEKNEYMMDIEFSYNIIGWMFLLCGLGIEFKVRLKNKNNVK